MFETGSFTVLFAGASVGRLVRPAPRGANKPADRGSTTIPARRLCPARRGA